MKSTRKALRDGELFKDTYGRFKCADCEKALKTESDAEELFDLRVCPECNAQYKDMR